MTRSGVSSLGIASKLFPIQVRSRFFDSVGAVTEEVSNPSNTDINTLASLKAELEQYPETRRYSAIMLEKDLDSQLTQFCKDRGITVEIFLEAAWAIASADETLVQKITTQAKRRYDQRKRVGQIKRLITMLGNSFS